MPFSERELRALARLSPSQRRAIYQEVYREASRAAYVTVDQETGLEDAGMGKSLSKRLKKAVKKVTAPVKRVVNKVEDAVKRVVDKTEETVKRIAKKAPGAEAVTRVAKKVQEQAKRAGGAVQRIAKEAARKSAPLLAIAMPLSLSVKSIRKNAAKFYRKHGAIIVTMAGTVLAPFTMGISAAAASLLVAGKKYYDNLQAAKEAERAGKAEAAQMAAAVQAQEAELNAQCDAVYSQAQDSFLAIGLTPEKWSALSVEAKLGIIDSLSNGKIPPGYTLTSQVEADAEAIRIKAQNDELDDLYVKYQATFEEAGYPPDQWYAMTIDEKYAVLEGLSAQAASSGVTVEKPTPSTPSTVQSPSAVTSSTSSTEKPVDRYDVVVEGELVETVTTQEAAAQAALAGSKKGDRVEIVYNGTPMGLSIRTGSGLIPVPSDQASSVRAMSHGEVVSKIEQAENSVKAPAGEEAKKSGGFPWLLLAVPAVLFVGAKAKGA